MIPNILKDNLDDEYDIYKITHYSARINKKDYKKEVLELEKQLEG